MRVAPAAAPPSPKSPAFVFPRPHLSAGDTRSKYRHSALDETVRSRRSEEDPFTFCFSRCLRASVVQRSCFWLRLRRAVEDHVDHLNNSTNVIAPPRNPRDTI